MKFCTCLNIRKIILIIIIINSSPAFIPNTLSRILKPSGRDPYGTNVLVGFIMIN